MEIEDMDNDQLLRPVLHSVDTAGPVYISREFVCRRISNDYQVAALKFLESPLFQELISKRLFPKTWINETAFQRGQLVIEHERAPFILQGWEWSFSMLKDAAFTILAVADLCEKHGYSLQDAHVYNVVFFSCQPMFVDFGSFREGRSDKSFPRKQFLHNSYLPLKLWSEGNFYVANRLLADTLQGRRLQPFISIDEIPLFRNYFKTFRKKVSSRYWIKMIANMVLWQIPRLRKYLFNVPGYRQIDYNLPDIRKRLEAIPVPELNTEWETYHDAHFKTGQVPARFSRIIDIISNYDWKTAVDLAGNKGYFTELLVRRFKKAHFLCLDYDSRVIDKQYNRICKSDDMKRRISLGIVNVMYPDSATLQFEDRIQADLVFALALTHHLLLRQNADIDIILGSFYKISRKFLVIEFMPIGLWDGKTAPPVPEWYTKKWFRTHLEINFKILVEDQLEQNRIVFFCEKKICNGL